ncbi:hypothetical protein ABUW04_29005 [Streptacidiphilus sp. N1-10]|uniref:Integral membrane protein n=1 Tax=Streptacidiphilus jeojiensis TaxID=3229225 RepID=A0ABV6XVL6_9ACTN
MAAIPPGQAPRWHAGTVLLALVPVVSCGLLAFAPAAYLAVLRRNAASWVALGVIAAMSGFEMYLSETAPKNGPSAAAGAFFLLTMTAPVGHFVLSLRHWQRQTAWDAAAVAQPAAYPPVPPSYGPNPYQQQPQPYQQPYQVAQPYQVQPPVPVQPNPLSYDRPAPATEDVGAELRKLSERLRGEPGQ